MSKPRLWTRDFLLISSVQLFFVLSFYSVVVVISGYAMDSFGSSPSIAGLAASMFAFGALSVRPASGRWIERIGRRKTLYAGTILGLTMALLYFAAHSISFLLFIRFFHGVSFGITSTATATIVANIVPPERRGEGIGYFALSLTVAMAVGPFLGMFISQHGSFNMVFMTSAIAAAISFLIALFVSIREIELTDEQLKEMKGFSLSNFLEPRVIPIAMACSLIYFCYSSLLSFLAVYSEEIHLVEAASFFFVALSAAAFFSRPFAGRLFDLKGENLVMYSAIVAFMLGMGLLSQSHQAYSILLAGVLVGLGYGAIQFGGQAIYVKITPPHRMGLASSTFFAFVDAGIAIGPFIFGLFVPIAGYRGIYLGAAIVAAVSIFLYYLVYGKNAGRPK
jgi:predicted MFS family arabinose efflux permease